MALYHIFYYLSIMTKGSAGHAALTTNVKIALAWIKKHTEKGDAPTVTLAIQTLRNTILIAIFIGGNSLAFGLGYSSNYRAIMGDEVLQLQYIIMCVCLLCSFLCWACVIRYASHVGYYIGTLSYAESNLANTNVVASRESIPNADEESDVENQSIPLMLKCANMIALALIFFNLGFRFMFVSLPFAFFTMGRIALLVATLCLLAFLYAFDYGASYAFFLVDRMSRNVTL